MTTWHSAYVHYHDAARHDAVILDLLRPLLADLPVAGGYFERHWLRGPHLRLHVLASRHDWITEIQPAVERRTRAYLTAHPSTMAVDERAAVAQHRLLAALEHESGPLSPWIADNTVTFPSYPWRLDVHGTRAQAELLAAFHTEATGPVLKLLDRIREGTGRPGICLTLMLALAHAQCPPVTRGAISYRSHAEYFLANSTDPERTRAGFEAKYAAHRDALVARLDAVLAVFDDRADAGTAFLKSWIPLWQRYRERGARLIETGVIELEPRGVRASSGPRVSAFQRTLEAEGIWERLRQAPWFLAYRLLLNNTYLQLGRLGCTPVERYLLCHLAGRTVEDRFGVSALDSARDLP
ncbi:thiopeptide maturation pyridine synthase [Nonomuraea typhae]|uniref:Thiopeptide maturation pyridine synthase n=1 Tax=Nonomuraea typhae TaxID=2603600 RepID=A0ABW7YTC6_9ACTN